MEIQGVTDNTTKKQNESVKKDKKKEQKQSLFKTMIKHQELVMAITSGVIILFAWIFTAYLPHTIWVILHIVAFLIGGYHQGKEGIMDTIENKELNVELLMVIAAIGSAAIGYWSEGAILIFIFAFAGALETYTMNKSENEISSLMDLQPEEAKLLEQDGSMNIVPVADLAIGNTIYTRAGERIPADGVITQGGTAVDESAITGESVPVERHVGEEVLAGTVALDGTIHIEITKQPSETLFQKIINMVQSAKDEKTPAQLFIEKFEGTYVKTVLAAVIVMMFLPYLVFGWSLTDSIYRAMILLVVASPCALVASIMPAALSAITKSAKGGVLFKGGVHAEMMSKITAMAFDKTGTITNGTPVVTDFYAHPDYDTDMICQISGAIEKESTHPLALAITNYSDEQSVADDRERTIVTHVKTLSGKGIIGTVNGETWHIGKEYLSEHDGEHVFKKEADTLSDEGKTVVYVSHQDTIVALFALKDTVREDAKKAIATLQAKGIQTIMLTGDNERTAKAVAEEVGMNDYIAECLPDYKVESIKKLLHENKKVAMIGDGINDAPALAAADIGIAMGGGTDVALETADMVLMNNDLTKITDAVTMSQKMNRIIKQNIIFSLSVITLLIISNFFQLIDLPFGVIGHEGSTILVILNGLRMLK